jgi:hypothetical protein
MITHLFGSRYCSEILPYLFAFDLRRYPYDAAATCRQVHVFTLK